MNTIKVRVTTDVGYEETLEFEDNMTVEEIDECVMNLVCCHIGLEWRKIEPPKEDVK